MPTNKKKEEEKHSRPYDHAPCYAGRPPEDEAVTTLINEIAWALFTIFALSSFLTIILMMAANHVPLALWVLIVLTGLGYLCILLSNVRELFDPHSPEYRPPRPREKDEL